jgi:hypothetical protein
VPLATTALYLECEQVLKRPEQRLARAMDENESAGFMVAFMCTAER